MNTNSDYSSDQPVNPSGNNIDTTGDTIKDRYYNSVRAFEDMEALFEKRLETRQEQAKIQQDHVRGRIEDLTTEYQADRARLKQAVSNAKLDLDAAHRSAAEHCAEIGVKYQPDVTTEADVLRVPKLHEDEAAKRLNLRFGVGINIASLTWIKPVLAVCCWVLSALGLGLLFRLIVPRALLANPVGVGVSLILGGLVTLALVVFLMPAWKSIGSKLGSGRPFPEVMKSGLLVGFITVFVFVALASLDAFSFLMMNAAKAALNPAAAMPVGLAILLGCVCSGLYVIGLAYSNFCLGYSEAARKSIDGFLHGDETTKREAAKRTVPVRAAIDSLANVKVVEERIAKLEADLQKLEQEFKRDYNELVGSLPTMPTEYEASEQQELMNLRQRMHSDKTKYEAHTRSRA